MERIAVSADLTCIKLSPLSMAQPNHLHQDLQPARGVLTFYLRSLILNYGHGSPLSPSKKRLDMA